jgi:hypothetical protein
VTADVNTSKDAERELDKSLRGPDTGTQVDPAKDTAPKSLERWLKDDVGNRIKKPCTRHSDEM